MNKTITTIIPFYNCKDALPRMLESILAGTMLPYEIILVDDGSNDGSTDVAYNYAQKYAFIKVLSQRHAGVSAARNLGIRDAGGYWISFLDADDYIEPDMYEQMLGAISTSAQSCSNTASSVDGCLCGYYTHKDGVVTPYAYSGSATLSSKEILRLMYTDDSVRGFLFIRLFKAALLKELSFDIDIRICEDLLFQTKFFATRNVRFACLPAPMYHYIQNQASATVTRSYFDQDVFIYKPAFERISEYIKEDYVPDSYNSILEHAMYTLLDHYAKDRSGDALAQIRLLQKEMRNTRVPFSHKSKHRIAYELAPVLASVFMRH